MRAKTLVPLFLLIVPQFLKSGLRMKQSLDVPVGLVYLQAGVIDPNSGHTGATEFSSRCETEFVNCAADLE